MTDAERREAARQFINKWNGKGNEDEDARSYWFDVLANILGMDNITNRVQFEKKVLGDKSKKRIDVYIPETHVLIEQKSLGIPLDKPQQGHDGKTPYEQAKEYDNLLPYDERARWIVTSNFLEIWIYDMSVMKPEPLKLQLEDLQNKYPLLDFLTKTEVKKLTDEMEVSIRAGEIVGLLYDAFQKQYGDMDNEENQKSLNALCVRLVFCLYAEDAAVFGRRDMFHDYMQRFDPRDMRRALLDLFKILDTPEEERDPYLEEELAEFPYVNGGLFSGDHMIIPQFTDEIKELLLQKASADFDWSDISPTIFGAVFESTLNPETRRSGGMHYTSIENIHKVIDPLFMEDLQKEFEEILTFKTPKVKIEKLNAFQEKIAGLKFLDPACGSGNFLTESYLSLRRLENEILKEKNNAEKGSTEGQISFVFDDAPEGYNPIKVSIQQFYGIEINDFACTVAKTALWIAESQMMKQTENVLHMNLDFLPLKSYVNITEANALRIDWNEVVPASELDYIMGNPPFVGYSLQNKDQKDDILSIYIDEKGKPYKTAGKIDYVSGWYFKAAQLVCHTKIRVAFVSTNSICQGEQVAGVWKPLYDRFNIHIDFAYRSFVWNSEASDKAHVHCVIVGFTTFVHMHERRIYDSESYAIANNISPYLVDAEDVFIESRKSPICNVPYMVKGSSPVDGGYFFVAHDEISGDHTAAKYTRRFYGAKEYIQGLDRWCLWLHGITPSEIRTSKFIQERIKSVRDFRLKSPKAATRKYAEHPTEFMENRQPDNMYILVPRHSSQNRRYIPFGFMAANVICGDANNMIPGASIFHFGILISNVHMAWMRTVCGRIKSDYRYSNDIVYNNFPWPDPTPKQKDLIEATAQGILDARDLYPDSSLADLYDPLTMPPELRKAHTANDKAVMAAYGFSTKMTEAECVAELMKMYQKLVEEKEGK